MIMMHYNEYFCSPKTILHKIKSYWKISTTFMILICCPYLNCNILQFKYYKIISIFIILVYPINLLQVLQKTYILILYNILYVGLLYHNVNTKNIKIGIKYFYHFFPKYIQRIYYLNLLNFFLLKILFVTTQNEKIFIFFIKFLKKFNYFKFINYNIYISILILSFQFIQKIINNFIDLYISVKIKCGCNYFSTLIISQKIIIKFLVTYSINLFENITYITSILWTRKLCSKSFFYDFL